MKNIIAGITVVMCGVNIFGGASAYNVAHPVVYAREPEPPKEVLIEVRKTPIEWNKERIVQEIRETFPEQPDLMVKVAQCESGLIPTAKGPTHDGGIFQIHVPSHKDNLVGVDIFDPADNIAFARKLYDQGGLQPWSASKHCWNK